MAEQRHLWQGGTAETWRDHRQGQDQHQPEREHGQPCAGLEDKRPAYGMDMRTGSP